MQSVNAPADCRAAGADVPCESIAFGPRASRQTASSHPLEVLKKMDWIPVVLVTFKVLVFGTGMFFAIKWHHDQGKKKKKKE